MALRTELGLKCIGLPSTFGPGVHQLVANSRIVTKVMPLRNMRLTLLDLQRCMHRKNSLRPRVALLGVETKECVFFSASSPFLSPFVPLHSCSSLALHHFP